MTVRGVFVSILLMAFARIVQAQPCELDGGGRGVVEQVRPEGTDASSLHAFRVETVARARLEGSHAELEVQEPLVFRGRAEARSVALRLGRAHSVAGVIRVERGVPVRARRVAGVAQLQVEAGATSFTMQAPCRDLVFGELPAEETGEASESGRGAGRGVAREDARGVRAERRGIASSAGMVLHRANRQPRRNTVRVFASATGSRGVTLRRLSEEGHWPELVVMGTSASRTHIWTTLAPGVTVDGWIESAELRDASGSAFVGGVAGGLCGRGLVGTLRYRGPATLAEGAALLDLRGHAWARTVRALEVEIVVVQPPARSDEAEETQVYVERIPGFGTQCAPVRARVSPTDVTYEPPANGAD
jgi:hypothetical protein